MEKIEVIIENTKEGSQTLKFDKYYLHSRYSPTKEARKIAEENYRPHHLHVIYGYGLGYLVEELVQKFQFNEPLLIIDPLIDNKKLTLKEIDYARIYHSNSTDFIMIANLLSQLNSYSNKIHVIVQQNYQNLFPENLIEILKLIKDSQIREQYNINTIQLFSLEWQLNTFINTKYIYNDYSLKELFDKYDAPIIVAASGPSLNNEIERIKINRKKFILICAGSTINVLLKNNIYPDYVVSIDGGKANYQQFKDTDTQDIELLYTPSNHRDIRGCFGDKAFVFIANGMEYLENYYKESINKTLPSILGGSSVAHYALSIAKKLTKGPICLIGQDLAYTNGLSHAEGNRASRSYKEMPGEVVEVDSYEGKKIKSSNAFKSMIHTFEQLQNLDIHKQGVFNCTKEGARIESIPYLPFEDFIERYCTLEVCKLQVPEKIEQEFDFRKFYHREMKKYNEIIELLDKGIMITEPEKGPYFSEKVLSKLSQIEKKLNKLYEVHNLDSLLEPVIIKNEVKFLPKISETKNEEFQRVKNYTIDLYNECKQTIMIYMTKLKEEIVSEEGK